MLRVRDFGVSALDLSDAAAPADSDRDGPGTPRASAVIDARDVLHRFEAKVALDGVSLAVEAGEIRALLGPNGAGKTTLLRILAGLVFPTAGHIRIGGLDPSANPLALRRRVGLIPAGDRSFYLRLSGFENLVFFGRLHGMRRKRAAARAGELLARVGLAEAGHRRVNAYSHGMQKRLSVARALLIDPAVLLVDEATHDLDPEGARRVRTLVQEIAGTGAAVIWATQRVEEVRGFVDGVTLLHEGRVRFAGSVADFLAHSVPQRYLLRVRNGRVRRELKPALQQALAGLGAIEAVGDPKAESYLLALAEGAVLGDAIASLSRADFKVIACREERSEIEDAFLEFTKPSGEISP